MTTTERTAGERIETGAQVVILLAVAGMAGAASFTHVHDWTMHNSPPGTGDWFGWANAVISDLIPLGAGLEVRRRRRRGLPVGWYPLLLIGAAALLSLAGQIAEAKPGLSGALLASVPALGFLALSKLVLSGPTTPTPAPTASEPVDPAPVAEPVELVDTPAPVETLTRPGTAVVPVPADAFTRLNGAGVRR
jgi:peptidoglycan/LPS O-acetylase OafA/YrhL